jgi:hypothetical protein
LRPASDASCPSRSERSRYKARFAARRLYYTSQRRRIPLLPTTLSPTIVLSSTTRTNVYVARLLTVLLVHGASISTEAVSHRSTNLQHNPHSLQVLNPSRSHLTIAGDIAICCFPYHRHSYTSDIFSSLLYALSFQVVLFFLLQSRNLIFIALPLNPTCGPVRKARRSSILWVRLLQTPNILDRSLKSLLSLQSSPLPLPSIIPWSPG